MTIKRENGVYKENMIYLHADRKYRFEYTNEDPTSEIMTSHAILLCEFNVNIDCASDRCWFCKHYEKESQEYYDRRDSPMIDVTVQLAEYSCGGRYFIENGETNDDDIKPGGR